MLLGTRRVADPPWRGVVGLIADPSGRTISTLRSLNLCGSPFFLIPGTLNSEEMLT